MPNLIEIKQKIPSLYLTWVINNICTNTCSYCPENLHNGTNHHYDWEETRRFVELLIDKYPKIQLAIAGGEPTLSPWFRDLIKMFSDAGHSVGVTTNGARTARYYGDVAQFLDYVVMSHHPSFADPELINKALACAEHTPTTVSIMFDSRYFDECLEFYNSIHQYPTLSAEPIKINDWGVPGTIGRDYTPKQIDIINSLPRINGTQIVSKKKEEIFMAGRFFFDDGTEQELLAQTLINEKKTNFQGWECDIGFESLFVFYDGRIKMANCVSSPYIGTIQDPDNIQWPADKFICPQTFCHCTTDVYVSKRKL